MNALNDNSSTRGIFTTQRVEFKALNAQQMMRLDRKNEASILVLSIEEASKSRHGTATEKGAEVRYITYLKDYIDWQGITYCVYY